MGKLLDHYQAISVLLISLLPPFMLFHDIEANYGVPYDFLFLVTAFNLLICFTFVSKKIHFNRLQRSIFIQYIIISIYLAFVAMTYYDRSLSLIYFKTYIKNIALGLLVLCVMSNKHFPKELYVRKYGGLMLVLSLFSVVLFGLYLGGAATYYVFHFSYDEVRHFPYYRVLFLGYLNSVNYGFSARSQSFYTEAAQFAQVLQVPLGLSLIRVKVRGALYSLVKIIIIAAGFALTFSVANYFAFGAMYVVYVLVNSRLKATYRMYLGSLAIAVLVVYLLFTLYDAAQGEYASTLFAKNIEQQDVIRGGRMSYAFSALNNSLVGDIRQKIEYDRNPGVIGNLAMIGGYPLLFLVGGLILSVTKSIFPYLRHSKNALIFFCFLGFLISHLWYGDFLGVLFIHQMAFISLFIER
ncbi:MAG: hypothetical protein PHU69_06470 [Fermentimonas sp.]|nr:hypothetical protein [Fermentimonas sp.]